MFTIRRSTANDVSSNIECEVIRTNWNYPKSVVLAQRADESSPLERRMSRLLPDTISVADIANQFYFSFDVLNIITCIY